MRSGPLSYPLENDPVKSIILTVPGEKAAALETLLIRIKASELSELRSIQTQLTVYGDRRSTMEGQPGVIEARMALLEELLSQVREQRKAVTG